MSLITRGSVSGVPLHYARTTAHPYGTAGRPQQFRFESAFFNKLEDAFDEIFELCPLGKPEVIVCAGAFVNKPNSHHRFGRAFDLDGLFWDDYTLLATGFHQNPELYLGIESLLRKRFGIVLSYFYNRAHRDHWHFDDGGSISFNHRSRSKVLYLQVALTYIYKTPVVIDGLWGPQTRGAYEDTLERLSVNGTDAANWRSFLDKTARICFRLFDKEPDPARQLADLEELVEELQPESGQRVREALNSFLLNPRTEEWLKTFSSDESRLAEAINHFS